MRSRSMTSENHRHSSPFSLCVLAALREKQDNVARKAARTPRGNRDPPEHSPRAV